MIKANLIEIFGSYQGEGPLVGEPMTFLRFQDCALSCVYCDTPASFVKHPEFRVEKIPGSGVFAFRPNPVTAEELTRIFHDFKEPWVSLTGGEPLQHGEFLAHWLPKVKGKHRFLLETNGVLSGELKRVIQDVEVVSMDLKLPSVTGMRPFWKEHREFLQIAREKKVYVKVVISAPTDPVDLERALALVEDLAPEIPFILQPVTPFGPVRETVDASRLQEFFEISKRHLPDVRVIPQMHPQWGVL